MRPRRNVCRVRRVFRLSASLGLRAGSQPAPFCGFLEELAYRCFIECDRKNSVLETVVVEYVCV